MALTEITGVAIRGIISVLPAIQLDNHQLDFGCTPEEKEKIIASTGIHRRRVVSASQTALDLAKVAASELLAELNWQDEKPELLIFVTQTPDYMLPGNAIQLQHHLNLAKSTIAFDVNLGCSGFVYGLWQITQLLNGLNCRRALLVVGDTTSTLCPPQQRTVAMLFGDAVSVVALEKTHLQYRMCFSLGSDGAGAQYLIQPFAAAKSPVTPAALSMDGTQVFVFTLREVPKSILEALKGLGWSLKDVDYAILHQANAMMLKHLGDKLGFTSEQLIIAMGETGNTSSASIPLAMTMALQEQLTQSELQLLLSGFGVGWSWGSVALTLPPLSVCRLMNLTTLS
jgi:3-oxoacyl-[acyl-carrier-protein] synthase-3